ncbi:tetratricopeptide repeat protein 13 [Lates japonicus]|uniref:Tetratricopeptide repeat protein 13 n=1 Tax=Lates japonicus TaxID=270547 RepID=A0AAD3RMC9_LATJO|nr:tetratricopeptide repeat protein 13 [Lates japonicus]
MAPASRAVVLVAISLLYLCRAIISTEYFSTLTLFNNELHKQGCSSLSEWEEYAADCESAILQLEDPDCEEGSNPPCESVFSLNAEKILDYVAAGDFQQSLELKKNQPMSCFIKSLTFFRRGMLKNKLFTELIVYFP